MLIMTSCTHKPVMAHARFVHLPSSGWQQSFPLAFIPEYDDSTLTYDLKLTVRHNNSYSYRNLSLTIDIFGADSTVLRQQVNMALYHPNKQAEWSSGKLWPEVTHYKVSVT